jgi:hypothetical protein
MVVDFHSVHFFLYKLHQNFSIIHSILGRPVDNVTEQIYLDSLLALGMMRYPYYHHPIIFIREGNKKLMDFAGHNITEIMLDVS